MFGTSFLLFVAPWGNVLAAEDPTADKTNKVGLENVPSHCKKIVPPIKTPKYSSLCIYPDSSYQSNQNLSSTFFAQGSKKIVKEMSKQIDEAVKKEALNREFFDELIKYAGTKRLDLALKQKTEGADRFGEMRGDSISYIVTPLGDAQYRDYQGKLLATIWQLYQMHKNDLEKQGICIQEQAYNMTSYFHFDILDIPELMQTPADKIIELTPGLQDLYLIVRNDLKSFDVQVEEEYQPDQAFQKIIDSLPVEHHALAYTLLETMKQDIKDKEFANLVARLSYIHGQTTLVTAEGKMHPGAEWVSILPKEALDSKNPDWSQYLEKSLRLQSFLSRYIKDVKPNMYDYFIKCLHSTTKKEFTDSLSAFQYLFAQISPYKRGTSAISEWFTKAICDVKDYVCSYNCGDLAGKCSLDLAALTSLSIAEYADVFSNQMSIISMGNQSAVDISGLIA
ncbi:MAG: hypothetical protein K2Y01_05380 [Rhabdochlamydiaceae bacterium]|nr:hypothetical protein [Rhabdochlamydiaceae bacterium]